MRITKEDKFNKLYAEEGKHIRAINDEYKPSYVDENGNRIEEYFPNYFTEAYVPKFVNEENVEEMYVEEDLNGNNNRVNK